MLKCYLNGLYLIIGDWEKETDSELKLIMLLNNWGSPVIAYEELLKRIDSNEQIIRRNLHIKFSELGYKSRYSELREKLCIEKKSRYI